MRPLRLVPALVRPTVRAMNWRPPLLATLFAFAVVELALRYPTPIPDAVPWLRVAAVLAALGAAFLLDDPAEPTTEALPGSLLLRRAVRAGLALPVVALGWGLLAARTVHSVPAVRPAVPGLALEAAALLAVTLALAAAGAAWASERLGGVVAAPGLLLAAVLAWRLPGTVALFVPHGAGWAAAHQRWAAVFVVAAAGFVAASRDPGRRRRRGRARRTGLRAAQRAGA